MKEGTYLTRGLLGLLRTVMYIIAPSQGLAHFRYLINVSSCLSVNVSSPEGAMRIGKKNTIKSILNMLLLDANSVECGK